MPKIQRKEYKRMDKDKVKEIRLANLAKSKLKPASELTEEERIRQSEICRKGAYATAEKKRLKRNLRETTLAMLEKELSKDTASKMLGDNLELLEADDIKTQSIMIAGLIKSAIEGNAKAFEVLRDTSGQTIKQSVEVDTNLLMTDADRTLMQNVLNRLNKNG